MDSVLAEITLQQDIRVLWVLSTNDSVLFTIADRLITQLNNSFADTIRTQYNIPPADGVQIITLNFNAQM